MTLTKVRVNTDDTLKDGREGIYCWSIQRVPVVHDGGVRFSLGP